MSPLLYTLLVLGAPLTLDEAVTTGLAHHPDLQVAGGQAAAAEAQARTARAPLLPQVDLTGRYGVDARWRDGSASPTTSESPGASLGAGLLLWDFGQASGRWHAAQSSAEAARLGLESSDEDVALAVRLAFLDARQARALIGVARQTLENGERHLEQITEMVKLGARPEIDLARLRTQVAAARAGLVGAENAERLAKVALRAAMGVPGDGELELADAPLPPLAGEERPLPELYDLATRERPELAALRVSARAQGQALDAADAGYLPSLRLSVAGSYSGGGSGGGGGGSGTGSVPGWSPWDATAGLTLNLPLFDGSATRAAIDAGEAGLVVARARLAGQELQVWQQLEQARLGIASARSQLAAAEQTASSAGELLQLAEARYAQGVGNALELADAQLALADALTQRVRADHDVAAARARLLRAVGANEWR